jgi:N-acetylglucosamine kinase-like BadF-type ATPase
VDALGRRLMDAFDARNGDELALSVTEAGSAELWGRRAPEVFSAADEGSEIADAVIRAGGEHLAESVHRLLLRGIPADAVVAGGSVIERQPRLQDSFRAALLRRSPELPLTILDRPPVRGALALARRLAHGDQ